jgi:hypothetical protein
MPVCAQISRVLPWLGVCGQQQINGDIITWANDQPLGVRQGRRAEPPRLGVGTDVIFS